MWRIITSQASPNINFFGSTDSDGNRRRFSEKSILVGEKILTTKEKTMRFNLDKNDDQPTLVHNESKYQCHRRLPHTPNGEKMKDEIILPKIVILTIYEAPFECATSTVRSFIACMCVVDFNQMS